MFRNNIESKRRICLQGNRALYKCWITRRCQRPLGWCGTAGKTCEECEYKYFLCVCVCVCLRSACACLCVMCFLCVYVCVCVQRVHVCVCVQRVHVCVFAFSVCMFAHLRSSPHSLSLSHALALSLSVSFFLPLVIRRLHPSMCHIVPMSLFFVFFVWLMSCFSC